MYFLKFLKYQYIIILACIFFALKAFSAGLTAQLSHNKIIDGDYFQLILSNDKSFDKPDLSELQKDFNTHGTFAGRSIRIINGQVSETHNLSINLSPKKQGKLTIPPIIIGNEQTQALPIEILDPAHLPKSKYAQGVDLLVSTDKTQYFELENIYVYVKLISNKPIYDGQLIPSTSDDYEFFLEKQGRLKQEEINSQLFWVVENQYKLQAKRMGEITLKPFRFDGVVEGDKLKYNNPTFLFNDAFKFSVNFNSVAQENIKIFSEPLLISIDTKPKEIKGWFLPAENVTLMDDFGQTSLSFKQNEHITRKINLTVYGARAEQLPEVAFNDVPGAKIYVESNQIENHEINGKHAAVRNILLTIIPTKTGTIKLPELKVKWFNTKTNQTEIAILPSKTLDILASNKQVNNTPVNQKSVKKSIKNSDDKALNQDKKKEDSKSLAVTPKIQIKKDDNLFSKNIYLWIIAILIGLIVVFSVLNQYKSKKRKKNQLVPNGYQKNNLSNSRFNNKRIKISQNKPKLSYDKESKFYFKQLKENFYKAMRDKDSTELYQSLLLLKRYAPSLNHNKSFLHIQQELELSKYQLEHQKNIDFNEIEQRMRVVLKTIRFFDENPAQQSLAELHPHQKK